MMKFFFPLLLLAALCVSVHADAVKIPLSPQNVVNESGLGNAGALVDEQSGAGVPKTSWMPGWGEWRYPASAFVDLGATYRVTRIRVYDGTGTGRVTFEWGVPLAWKPLFEEKLESYQQWNEHAVDAPTRYLRVTVHGPNLDMPEIVVYGEKLKDAPPRPVVQTVKMAHLPMEQFVGVNAFIDDPTDKIAAVRFVREYHNWEWDEAAQGVNAWNPSAAGGGGWFFDEYYARLAKLGITVCPAVQGTTRWLNGNHADRMDDKPAPPEADPLDPASYRAHGAHMFQFAARYGARKLPDAQLQLTPNQPRKSGQNLLRYLENANEPDKTWRGRGGYSSPFAFAAQCSADYDGHLGRLGKTVGVKNADSKFQLVLGGLAGLRLDYVQTMAAWADAARGGSFPADVLNFHHYSNAGGDQEQLTRGISPEDDKLEEKARALVLWRDKHLPDKPVWVTEFGYDRNPGSPQSTPAIGTFSRDAVRTQWILRSYLALAAAGVDRAALYMLRDVDPGSATQFSTSGLVESKEHGEAARPEWNAVNLFRATLTGFRFDDAVPTKNPAVRVLRFRNGPRLAFAVWCPTSDARAVPDFRLSLPAGTRSARVISFQPNAPARPLTLDKNSVSPGVSEWPVIVVAST